MRKRGRRSKAWDAVRKGVSSSLSCAMLRVMRFIRFDGSQRRTSHSTYKCRDGNVIEPPMCALRGYFARVLWPHRVR